MSDNKITVILMKPAISCVSWPVYPVGSRRVQTIAPQEILELLRLKVSSSIQGSIIFSIK
jgi:hypothetical protein